MRGEPFNPNRATTHGIEVKPLVLPHPGEPGEKLILRLWDFGGQEVYRVTHQFFLTRRALNLVVWHARHGQEQDQVEDWLRRLRLRVKAEAPALVVATYCAERLADLDYPQLRKLFPEMLPDGPFEIDSETGQGIDGLVAAIGRHAARLPQMGQLISKRWGAVRAEILSRAAVKPQIRYSEYVDQGALREGGTAGHEGGLPVAEGEGLRALRATIFASDEARAFGGLRRVMSPAGDLLWVCTHHYPVYDPGLPVIP